MEKTGRNMSNKGRWRVRIMKKFLFRSVIIVILTFDFHTAIHMKYVSLVKLNKDQIMVELRSALGQYLKQFIMLWTFHSQYFFSLFILLLPGT